jgi:prepilin-type N-terminal cleavage/methylation domain-containing protein
MRHRDGLTLIELLIVLLILVALAGMVVPMVAEVSSNTQKQTTDTNLVQLRDTIMNSYRPDMNKQLPRPDTAFAPPRQAKPQLRYLFVNPKTETLLRQHDPVYRLGWRGPYLLQSTGQYSVNLAAGFTLDYGENGDPTVIDGWGRPIVIYEAAGQAWLISAGPDGFLEKPPATTPLTDPDNLALRLY